MIHRYNKYHNIINLSFSTFACDCVHKIIYRKINTLCLIVHMTTKVTAMFCSEQLDEKGICTLLGFYCRVFAFGVGLALILFGSLHSKATPIIATYGIITGIFSICLESSFIFLHMNCFPSIGKFFDNYLSRIFFYSVAGITGIVIHYQREKEPTLFILFVLLAADSILFVFAHFQRQKYSQYRDSGSFGVGFTNTEEI